MDKKPIEGFGWQQDKKDKNKYHKSTNIKVKTDYDKTTIQHIKNSCYAHEGKDTRIVIVKEK